MPEKDFQSNDLVLEMLIEDPEPMLIISCAGIGNAILSTPLIRATRRKFPDAKIDLLTWNEPAAACLCYSDLVDEIHVFPDGFIEKLIFIYKLKKTEL